MLYKTHLIIGVTAAEISILLFDLNKNQGVLLILFSIIGSLLPDIDERKSKINQFLPLFFSSIFTNNLRHRGLTHNIFSVIFFIMLSLFVYIYTHNNYYLILTMGLTLGYILHILADAATYAGIENFFLNKKFKFFKNGLYVGSYKEGYIYLFFLWAHIFLFIGIITYQNFYAQA